MDLNKTGLFISTLRKENNMTQKELAEKLGVTDKAVSRWETGKGFPDVSFLVSLAEMLGVSVTEIIKGERMEMENKEEMAAMDKEHIRKIKPLKPLLDKLSLLGYVLIAVASSGYYERVMFNRGIHFAVWIILGVLGGVCLAVRNREYYKQNGQIPSLIIDMAFVLAVLFIPKISLLPGEYSIVEVSTRLMQVLVIAFIPIYIYALSPWRKYKKVNKDGEIIMMSKNIKPNRIIWAVGAVIVLCLCFLLCRFAFYDLHGNNDWLVLLFILGLVVLAIATVKDARKVMLGTLIGYIGGFAMGIIFGVDGVDGVDPGGGRTNNWWVIWTCVYLVLIIAGVAWELANKRLKTKNDV